MEKSRRQRNLGYFLRDDEKRGRGGGSECRNDAEREFWKSGWRKSGRSKRGGSEEIGGKSGASLVQLSIWKEHNRTIAKN
jgi:hypothetical protein